MLTSSDTTVSSTTTPATTSSLRHPRNSLPSSSSIAVVARDDDVNGILRTVLVCRVADALCSHISLVRPLGSGGKTILSNDIKIVRQCMERFHPTDVAVFTELDAVNNHLLQNEGSADDGINSINSMSRIMVTCLSMSPNIRPSICWHHIVKHGPPQLQLPHRRHGWSQARYLVS